MKRTLIAAALVLVAGYVAFPYYATHMLERAIRSGDRELLARSVDTVRLRASLQEELGLQLASLDRQTALEPSDGRVRRRVLAADLVASTASWYVTAAGLASLVQSGELSLSSPATSGGDELGFGERSAFFSTPTTFRVELPKVVLELRLQGWWQLVAVYPKHPGPFAQQVTARLESETSPQASLPFPGKASDLIEVAVNASPWARIAIDGVEAGETPLVLDLPRGAHTFRVEFAGGRVIQRDEVVGPTRTRIDFK